MTAELVTPFDGQLGVALRSSLLFYQRLETLLKNADPTEPLQVWQAYQDPEVKRLCRGDYQVRAAFEIFANKGLVRKIATRLTDGGRVGGVGYYWEPERIAESAPQPSPGVGKTSVKVRKHGTRGQTFPPYATPEIPEKIVNTAPAARRTLRAKPQAVIEDQNQVDVLPPEKRVTLDFAGKVFTGPEGSKVNVATDEAGNMVVSFTVKQ